MSAYPPTQGYTGDMLSVAEIFPETIRPLRRVEYEKMVDLGLFEDERVELIDGLLVAMSLQGTQHAEMLRRLSALLREGRWTSPRPAPESARVRGRRPAGAGPRPGVIEVAETSLRKDRLTKGRVYTRAGVPEYWIVNLVDKIVEVHTGPGTAGYATVTEHRHGDTLRPSVFGDIDVNLGELLAGL